MGGHTNAALKIQKQSGRYLLLYRAKLFDGIDTPPKTLPFASNIYHFRFAGCGTFPWGCEKSSVRWTKLRALRMQKCTFSIPIDGI